ICIISFNLGFIQWIIGLIQSLVFGIVLAAIAAIVYPYWRPAPVKKPELRDKWFGKSEWKDGQPLPTESTEILDFEVQVPEETLTDLKQRLESSRYVDSIVGTNFNYGFNGQFLREVCDYWRTDFDWRRQEQHLNSLKQYTTQIAGLSVHFIHVKPSKPAKKIVPILVIHGWPGSVWEYYKAIPLLVEPKDGVAFEVICPSIPGYGFSEAPHKPGFGVPDAARVFVKLMDRLGHKRFFVHGGDWGSVISKAIARNYPENTIGVHYTMGTSILSLRGKALGKYIVGAFVPSLVLDDPEREAPLVYPFWKHFSFLMRESGYMHIQATKPDTVGASLLNSPAGLAAWILEKYSTWTNPDNVNKPDGGLKDTWTLDELLTQIMIYWVSGNVTSSLRFYKESMGGTGGAAPITVPAGVADFPHELARSPKSWARNENTDLVRFTTMPRGGHFGQFEEPELITTEIRAFVKAVLNHGQPLPTESTEIRDFEVQVPEETLTDLRQRLESTRYVDSIVGTNFNYGFNGQFLREVCDYWRTDFDWRRQEQHLNSLKQYTTQIAGLSVHFIHVKPSKPAKKIVPILVIHGWPGSVWEYYKAIPLLLEPKDGVAFEVICPSIPGYGFSEAPHKPGFAVPDAARVFVKLMDRLGHKRFFLYTVATGGHTIGVYTTMGTSILSLRGIALGKYIVGAFAPSLVLNKAEREAPFVYPFWKHFSFIMRESGYFHIQATKPDTVGASLLNSPAGLAAWILNLYSTWTNADNVNKSDGGLKDTWTLDELLTQIMIYWVSGNVTSSLRFYKESMGSTEGSGPITVPAGVADFPHELIRSPKSLTSNV
ncbi:unnamed protein product, partial [Medioppia subpectinata]